MIGADAGNTRTAGAPRSVRIVGAGRAGGAFALALGEAGWEVELLVRGVPLDGAAAGIDLLLLCVPDAALAEVAEAVEPRSEAVVAHCAGALTLDVLAAHPHRASIHPLVSLPSPAVGAVRLRDGAWFGVAAVDDQARSLVLDVVGDLGGRVVEPPEDRRATYHAAAVVASNHIVALMGQVERLASTVGVPVEAYLGLAIGSISNVAELGPAAALTGPVARDDWATVRAHLDALPADERDAYRSMAVEAARLAGRDVPAI